MIEQCGAAAIATSSAALAWAHGYADGHHLPARVVLDAIAEITRVVGVPVSADVEGGYADDPARVAELVAEVASAGAAGVNLEDGTGPVELLCAKLDAVKQRAARAGLDVFVNARIDVYLRGLVAGERALPETLERIARVRAAGCDGVFVPRLPVDAVPAVVEACGPLPLNLLAVPELPAAAALRERGVRRLSAGSALGAAALGNLRDLARGFLADGASDPLWQRVVDYGEMNRLLAAR
ncbi:MAG: isocitrate lyase/phosphoenolpyruvate mutase family protein [Thermodesulfobacteriota bacterium]